MTNLEQLKKAFIDCNIAFTEDTTPRETVIKQEFIPPKDRGSEDGPWKYIYAIVDIFITIGPGTGYAGFETLSYFDKDGKCLGYACYE